MGPLGFRHVEKLTNPTFFTDTRPVFTTDSAKALNDETLKPTSVRVIKESIDRIPGDKWAKTGKMRAQIGV